MPAKLKTTTFTNEKHNSLHQWTGTAHPPPTANASVAPTASLKRLAAPQLPEQQLQKTCLRKKRTAKHQLKDELFAFKIPQQQ